MAGKQVAGLILLVLAIGGAVVGALDVVEGQKVAMFGGSGGLALVGLVLLVTGRAKAPPPNYATMSAEELATTPGPKCRACRKPTRWVVEYKKHYCNTCRLYV